ncbi:MAG: hypothetical protein EOO57_07970 [Hymenobacter sp.]|nr:MAG: hypothetical protein EOO57_07970 [Hymenobacter sp.]
MSEVKSPEALLQDALNAEQGRTKQLTTELGTEREARTTAQNQAKAFENERNQEREAHTKTKNELADATKLVDELTEQLAVPAGPKVHTATLGSGATAKTYRFVVPQFYLAGKKKSIGSNLISNRLVSSNMSIVLDDLEFEEGTINMGGTAGKVYAIPASDVESITPPAAGTMTVLAGGVKFKTGKKCAEIYTTADTGEVKDTEVGDKDSGSFETNAEFWTPRISDKVLNLKSKFANGGFILVMKDGNGTMRIIGSKDHPAYRVPKEIATGKAPKDRNGATFAFVAASATPAFIYTGTVADLLTPGV